jgi:hypothetical protein
MPRCELVAYVGASKKKFFWFCSAIRSAGLQSSNIVHIEMIKNLRMNVMNMTPNLFFVDDTSGDEFKSQKTIEIIKYHWPNICIFVITSNATLHRRVDLLRSGAHIVLSEDDCSPTDIAFAMSVEAHASVNLLYPTRQ